MNMKQIHILFLLLMSQLLFSQTKSYLPDQAVRSVVLLEKKVDSLYIPHGTGFLMLSYDKEKPVTVVTNEHVLRNRYIYVTVPADTALINYMNKNKFKTITLKGQTWEFEGNKIRLEYELIPDSTFVHDKELDIAAFKINMGNSVELTDTSELQISNISSIGISTVKFKKDIPLGTEIYFIGFPFSIGTEYGWNYKGYYTKLFSETIPTPLVREGIVAWTSPNYDLFLLDAFSYSGNSGSPVFTKNDIQNQTYLIGIVAGHLPSDKSDNVGLARCIWSDKIIELTKKLK